MGCKDHCKKRDVQQGAKETSICKYKQVLDWFESINDKNNKCFIKFDIQNFYPCISRGVLEQALAFARTYTDITEEDEDVILHACRTILTHDNSHWKKKSSEDDFDVPMGSFHGAELCELVGLFLLDKLKRLANSIEYGIYRDDGLAVTKKSARTNLERIAKQIREVFGEFNSDFIVCDVKFMLIEIRSSVIAYNLFSLFFI